MGVSTVTAARILEGQKKGKPGMKIVGDLSTVIETKRNSIRNNHKSVLFLNE